ncbi:hypothetical protein EYF80_019467 [Liparis tanakae]|uniref:Uncharacterized protein n=1 Tax=Liparis tanakae TaxID=230148 RepID=A0A4Z2HZ47_9TELE|nr:hypothetical protein EYF80_019467 [Liparis tanakae]
MRPTQHETQQVRGRVTHRRPDGFVVTAAALPERQQRREAARESPPHENSPSVTTGMLVIPVFGGLCMVRVRRRVRLNKQFERSIAPDEIKGLEITLMYSRVPSKRVAMVSRKVFCGAFNPLITGIRERVEPRLSRRSEPWLSAAGVTKPGRNLDEVPGAPPNPWRRAPSRDARDSTVRH